MRVTVSRTFSVTVAVAVAVMVKKSDTVGVPCTRTVVTKLGFDASSPPPLPLPLLLSAPPPPPLEPPLSGVSTLPLALSFPGLEMMLVGFGTGGMVTSSSRKLSFKGLGGFCVAAGPWMESMKVVVPTGFSESLVGAGGAAVGGGDVDDVGSAAGSFGWVGSGAGLGMASLVVVGWGR